MKRGALIAGALAVCGWAAAEGLKVGVGASGLEDARAAGADAAALAKASLGGVPAKVVLVFGARKQVCPGLVAGVAEQFDKALIYGCEGYSPLTSKGNFADQGHTIQKGVAVLALGGGVAVTVASQAVEAGPDKARFAVSGERLGAALKAAVAQEAAGKLILSFGNQHVGDNGPFTEGFYKGLGATVPMVGAAAGGQEAKEIVQGEIVSGVNVAVMLAGPFKLGVGLAGGSGDLVGKASEAFASATQAGGKKPLAVFVFDCGGRRGELFKQKRLADEHAAMTAAVPGVPLFGFYGGGEIGAAACGQPSKGVGFHIAVAALYE